MSAARREADSIAESTRGSVVIRTTDANDTRTLGRRLAASLRAGDVILLHGDLGSGKTTLTQGIAGGLGISSPVQSPTFVLAHEHAGRAADGVPLALHHLDLYRLAGEVDAAAMGYADYLAPVDAITIVEWPERAGGLLPDSYLLVELHAGEADDRLIRFAAVGEDPAVERWLAPLAAHPSALR